MNNKDPFPAEHMSDRVVDASQRFAERGAVGNDTAGAESPLAPVYVIYEEIDPALFDEVDARYDEVDGFGEDDPVILDRSGESSPERQNTLHKLGKALGFVAKVFEPAAEVQAAGKVSYIYALPDQTPPELPPIS